MGWQRRPGEFVRERWSMARLRVIDVEVPDSQVEAILRQFRMPGEEAAPAAAVESRPLLPAAAEPVAPVAELPAKVVLETPLSAGVRARMGRKPGRKAKASAEKPAPVGKGAALIAAMPGTVREIAQRLGRDVKKTSGMLAYLKKNGKVTLADGVWSAAGAASARPVKTAEPSKTTAELFVEALASGPADAGELMTYAQRCGKPIQDKFHAGNILRQMEKRGEVVEGPEGRWALARRATA